MTFSEPIHGYCLDAGCGTGFLTFALHELGHRVTGIDLSPGMMSIAEKRTATLSNPPQFRLGDAEVLPFPDGAFDGVVCRYALWNLPRPEVALREWVRVVKPGGLILVIDGVWVYQGWLNKLAGVMRTIHRTLRERRRIGFDAELQSRLPFSHGIRLDELESLMTEAGIAVAGSRDLQALRVVQQRSLVWYLRYSFTWPTHMVWGRTAGVR